MAEQQGQGWADVVDSFLTQYVFRDLVSKCVPGLVLMWFVAVAAWGSEATRAGLANILKRGHVAGGWLLLLVPFSWVAGLLVQGAAVLVRGEALYYPPRDYKQTPKSNWPRLRRSIGWVRHVHHDGYYDTYDAFISAPATASQRRTRERYAAAKEASAHVFFALVLGYVILRFATPWELKPKRVGVGLMLGFVAVVAHWFHGLLEWHFMEHVVKRPRPTGAVAIAGSRKEAAGAVATAAEAAAAVELAGSQKLAKQAIANQEAALRVAKAARAAADAEPEA